MLRAFPDNLRKTTETIIPRAPPARTVFDDVSGGALLGPTSVLGGTSRRPGFPKGLGRLGLDRGSPAWGSTGRGSCVQGYSEGGVPNRSAQRSVPLVSPSPRLVLQFLAPSSPEEPAVRSEGQFQPDPAPREQVEVYPEAGTWDLVMAGIGTALLGGGILFLLLTVSGGRWKSPPPAARTPLLKGRGPCPCGGSSGAVAAASPAAPMLSCTLSW